MCSSFHSLCPKLKKLRKRTKSGLTLAHFRQSFGEQWAYSYKCNRHACAYVYVCTLCVTGKHIYCRKRHITRVWLKMCLRVCVCACVCVPERSLAIFLARSPFKSNPPLASTREIDAEEVRDSQIDREKGGREGKRRDAREVIPLKRSQSFWKVKLREI